MISPEAELADQLARAQTLHQQGQVAEARRIYEEVVEQQPDHADALNALGVMSGQSSDPQRAIRYFDRVLAAQPDHFRAHCNRGLALQQLSQPEAALASFEAAIAVNPDDPTVHYGRAETYRQLGRSEEALSGYARAQKLNPSWVQPSYRRGGLLQQLGRFVEAIADFDLALAVKPDHVDAHLNRAFLLSQLRRYEEALAGYVRLLELRPEVPGVHLFHGNMLKELNRREEAAAAYGRAIALDPNYSEAYANRGIVLYDLGFVEEALASYGRAIEIKPDYADAYFNRAYVLRSLKRFDAATLDYERAARLSPGIEFLPGVRMETRLQTCDWTEFESLLAEITAGVESGRPVSHPFNLLGLVDSPSLQLKAARIWMSRACPADESLGPIPRWARHEKLRVGYFSPDFREHPTSRLLAELIETHDRSRFEVFGFSFGPDTDDEARRRLIAGFDQFTDVDTVSNRDVASLARSLELDIAVDLGGYTHNGRLGIFALRAAPIQVSYLGYLGTLGTSYIDYVLADPVVVTPASAAQFTEKVVYLPDTFQVNDRKRRIAERIFTRAELGLPPAGFVFCCFNTSYKILPTTFSSWMRILGRVPLSVLFLLSGDAALEANLRASAARHRIDPRRLVFADRLPPAEYLARYRAADLFLDTLPYNAGATASDALWAGLPVLTLAGDSFASRIAASLLRAVGLPELITTSRDAYEDLAVALASDPLRLRQIRNRLLDTGPDSTLFDTDRFRRHLEAAFLAMQARYDAGLAPDHIRL